MPSVDGIHPIVGTLFARRGIASEDAISFLNPEWTDGIHDHWQFTQMHAAVDRMFLAIEKGEQIVVHGDYDADGVTGSAVLMSALKEVGATNLESYIPHRDKEGYGLNPTTVRYLHEKGTNLIITVDCGIANVDEIALARSLGMDVIVVDHHQFGDVLPDGILIHPRIPGETYPFHHLAAVGVAWKVACALCDEGRKRGLPIVEGWEKWLLDLVAIATVTDMVPMVGENRVLEVYGLRVMNKSRRIGLRKLIELAGCEYGKITSESIAFGLGPRINAAGRMDHASLALRLLLAENEEDADRLGHELEEQNKRRQKATAKMMEEAEAQFVAGSAPLAALWSSEWSPALVGLVAGKFLDRIGKPTIAIGKHGSRWIGSGRSFPSYDITQAVKIAGEGLLTHSGGHIQACGFSFDDDAHLPLFIERLQQHATQSIKEEDCVPLLEIDADIALEEINWQLVETIIRLEPFGEGNKRPMFVTRGLTVVSLDLVGQQQNHVRCRLRSPAGRTEQFIGFKLGDRAEECAVGNTVDVVYDVGVNEWNGRRDIQCKLVDFRVSQ